MPRPPRLSPDELSAALLGLPLWSGDGDGLRRTVELPSFRDAVDAIVSIADVAEEMDHHPDIDLGRGSPPATSPWGGGRPPGPWSATPPVGSATWTCSSRDGSTRCCRPDARPLTRTGRTAGQTSRPRSRPDRRR